MWVEKYRPTRLDDLVNQNAIKQRLKLMLEKKEQLPHLLFAGPPGSGKTTTAMIISRQILKENSTEYTLSLNASDERGIDIVRERVKTFARFADRREGVPYRIVILDESDEMCLDPESRVITGALDNLGESSLGELHEKYGTLPFNLPSFSEKGMRLENDMGRIVPSGEAVLYRIQFEDGRFVLASADHPFFMIQGRQSKIVRTRELRPGMGLAEFSDRILRCHSCSKPFYRQNRWAGYTHRFCSTGCRNVFFGSLSSNRTKGERQSIAVKAHLAQKAKRTFQSPEYRRKRAAIAKALVAQGKIPDPRSWPKFRRGEGVWVGKTLSEEHRKSIAEGDKRFLAAHPEIRSEIARKVSASLLDPAGPYQRLVRSGFFRATSVRASKASLASWKAKGFRSDAERTMGALLTKWGLSYERERVILSTPRGRKYPFAIDFVVGKVAIFVHGCWWHVCPTCGVSAQYEKQRKNIEKDERHYAELERMGYRVVVIWEHELEDEESLRQQVLPRVYQAVGVSGGAPLVVKHARIRSVERVGMRKVLNINMSGNKNFLLANGVLTHNTGDAQTALRRIMEETATYTRFILVCNYSSGIIEPLQSRCAIFRFQRLDEAAVVGHLKEIAKKERLKPPPDGVFEAIFEATQGDLRQAINLMQAASASGELTLEGVKAVTGATVKSRVSDVIKTALDGDFEGARTKMLELTRVYGIPERDFLKFANEAVLSMGLKDVGKAVTVLAEYDFRLVEGAQPELQLTAMLAQLAVLKARD